MNNEKLDRVKRKISKLMNLANGTANQNEAENAMRKAALLMARFHVNEGDLQGDMVTIKKPFDGRMMAKNHEQSLFFSVCESMGVFALYKPMIKVSFRKKSIPCGFILTGYAADIEVAWYLFHACLNNVDEQANSYRLSNKYNRVELKTSDINKYKIGLAMGLSARFKKMKDVDIEIGTGLVPVDTREKNAEAWYLEVNGKDFRGSSLSTTNSEHISSGYSDSKNININAGVNGTKSNQPARLTK